MLIYTYGPSLTTLTSMEERTEISVSYNNWNETFFLNTEKQSPTVVLKINK